MHKIAMLLTALISFTLLGLFSCAYNQTDNLKPAGGFNVSYVQDIKPILVQNCYTCHSDTATNPDKPGYAFFNNFTQLQYYATSPSPSHSAYTRMQARLRYIDTPGMPLNAPPLSDSIIQKLEQWIAYGAPNN